MPYAFPFRSHDGTVDFVLINVHLRPGSGEDNRNHRKHELDSIATWIDAHDDEEKDFIIVGDMNIQSCTELVAIIPTAFESLNDECRATNTSTTGKPFDHVMFRPAPTTEIDSEFDFEVIDLVDAVRSSWNPADGTFPGEPYQAARFAAHYSDHHPVAFRIELTASDDD